MPWQNSLWEAKYFTKKTGMLFFGVPGVREQGEAGDGL